MHHSARSESSNLDRQAFFANREPADAERGLYLSIASSVRICQWVPKSPLHTNPLHDIFLLGGVVH